jgi:hypothetical protein
MTDKERWIKEYKHNRNFAWIWTILFAASAGLAATGGKPHWDMTFIVMVNLIFNYADKARFFKTMSK